MSTYAVFGMTPAAAMVKARKKVPTHKEYGAAISEKDWLAKVKTVADEIMGGSQCIQLSDKFDAPQFADEYLALAQKFGGRSLYVKAYSPTGDRNPSTGRPVMSWTLIS